MTPAAILARVYLSIVVGTAAVALMVVVGPAEHAREALGFTFPGLNATASEAGSIFVANLRVMLVAFAGCVLQQWPWLRGGETRGRGWRAAALGADAVILAVVTRNLIVVGSGIGGYGMRMVKAVLPHAPVELFAFAAALTLYLLSRREPLQPKIVCLLGGGAVLALAAAAVLEAFGAPAG